MTQIQSRRAPHALLIAASPGVGAPDFALAAAQFLLCIAPLEEAACGKCKSCLLLQADAHPDLQILAPEGSGKAIKIDQVRQVSDFVAQTAQQGGRKVIIVHPAERMNLNAANALLKNLEEPSGDCVFLLVSESPALLLATIRSRCQRMDLRPATEAMALEWLEGRGVADAKARLDEADGCPLRAVSLLENDVSGQRKALIAALQSVMRLEQSPAEASRALLKLDPIWVLDEMLRVLTSAAKLAQAGLSVSTEGNDLETQIAAKPRLRIFALYGKLLQSKRLILSGVNPNTELMFNDILIDLSARVGKSG